MGISSAREHHRQTNKKMILDRDGFDDWVNKQTNLHEMVEPPYRYLWKPTTSYRGSSQRVRIDETLRNSLPTNLLSEETVLMNTT